MGIENTDQSQQTGPGHGSPEEGRHFLSLGQWLFLLLALFLAAPLGLSSLWGYLQSRRSLTEAGFQNIRNVASLEAAQVMLYVRNAEDLFTSTFLSNRHLAELVRDLNGADDDTRRRARDELRSLQRNVNGLTPVEEIELFSPAGVLLVSTRDDDGPNLPAAAPGCVQTAGVGPAIAGFSYEGRQPSLLVAGALAGTRGERLGSICVRFRFDFERQLVLARRERTAQAALYLLNENGQIVSGAFEDRRHASYGKPFRSGARAAMDLSRPWQGRYVSDSGEEELAAYAPISSLGWGVAVEEPVAYALGGLRRLEWEASLSAVGLALLVIVAATWSWQTVVRPLRALSLTAERMASGATGETVAPGGSRETAELATAFNRMSLALCESQHVLEQRITERTGELQESKEFAELLLNSIDHRVIVVDRDYRVVKANTAALRMFGAGLIGAPCYRTFEGRSEPCEGCAVARTFSTGQPASAERSQQTGNGVEAVQVETYPVFRSDGRVESVIEIGRIVTAAKQMQVQAMHQEKMAAFGLLAAGVAHEIGNPLAAIESQLRLAGEQPERQNQTLAIVRKEIGRMSRLLRELVDFAGRRRDALTLVSVNQVVEDVTRLLRHDRRARMVTIEHRLAPNLPGIRTTEDRLFQVLLNLGLNGLDAMPGGGTLELETQHRKGWVVVRIRDTGNGIPDEVRPRLFEPFLTTKPPGRGTGLGLFVSKGIVDSMGGEMVLEHSDSHGTSFVVFLRADPSAAGASV